MGDDPYYEYYNYMRIGASGMKFKVHPGPNGFDYWEMSDGDWLTLTYSGWAYHTSQSKRIGWKIVNGKVYNNYSRWANYPLGFQFQESAVIPAADWVGVGIPKDNVFTCELVPAP